MKKEQPEILNELHFLEAYYDDFNFNSYNFFISIVESEGTKDFITKKYEKISQKYNNEVIYINNDADVKCLLITPIKQQYLNVQEDKFFQNKTFIVNLYHEDQKENEAMITTLRGVANHLVKKTAIKIHLIMKEENTMNLLIGSDFWEFRTHTFNYPETQMTSIKLMDDLDNSLSIQDKYVPNKKNKL